ncbi:hypothetical protein K8R43_01145 [archaeon]|nr:hypothetical protein [archaeon]
MRRGLFSFLVVVVFIPTVLYSVSLHARAVECVALARVKLLEQQTLTNQEHEFEHTFWASSVKGIDLGDWSALMEEQGISVEGNPKDFLEKSPGGLTLELKYDTDPYKALSASFVAGNASSVFLIPVGCSHEL